MVSCCGSVARSALKPDTWHLKPFFGSSLVTRHSSLLLAMRIDPAELEIFKNLFHSVAEEMGAALRRSAFSPNIKERRDYSCAVFDGKGRVAAMGDHMPVHLGSMPMSVAAALEAL